jgi:hypothetical protein
MHANAADVSGNNVPVTGGTYNADGLTVADVLSTAVAAPAVAANTPVTPAAAPTAPTAPAVPAVQAVANAAPTVDTSAADSHHSPVPEMAHHFHHMWG